MTQEALKELLEAVEAAIQAGDWKVDGACDPDKAISRARKALAHCPDCGQLLGDAGHIHTCSPQPEQELVAYDKTEMNGFVQDLYDKKMQEGRHGHYETMFHVVHQAIKRATPPQRLWVGLTGEEAMDVTRKEGHELLDFIYEYGTGSEGVEERIVAICKAIEAKLKQKNGYAEEKNT